jgi:hypothetical protein
VSLKELKSTKGSQVWLSDFFGVALMVAARRELQIGGSPQFFYLPIG